MPIRELVKAPASPQGESLKKRLIEEWRNPESSATEPIIVQSRGGANQPLHVYVIWGEWDGMDQLERSQIVLDAYAAVFGQQQSLNLTVALGLTPREAERMGIHYQ